MPRRWHPTRFFFARLIATTINSSWMVLFFSLPIFAAYGSVFGGGIELYLWIAIILPLFLLIPAAIGALVTHLLVYAMPAKRIRDLLFFIGLFAFLIMYFLFRFSQPERLVQPESFGNFMQFLSAMETPSSSYLPSSWLAEILAGTLFKRDTDQGFFFALLASYAMFLPLAASWCSSAVYLDGWSKAQESRQGRRKLAWLDRLLEVITRPFPVITRAIHAQGHQDLPARHHPMVPAVFTRRPDRRLSLQLQSPAPRPFADAGGNHPHHRLLRQSGPRRICPQRHRHPLRLSRGEFGRQSLLAAPNCADLVASIVVEQVLVELRTAVIARRGADILQ